MNGIRCCKERGMRKSPLYFEKILGVRVVICYKWEASCSGLSCTDSGPSLLKYSSSAEFMIIIFMLQEQQ